MLKRLLSKICDVHAQHKLGTTIKPNAMLNTHYFLTCKYFSKH